MKTIKSIIAALILTVGTLTIANAQTRVHVGINTPGLHVSVGNSPYYHRGYYAPVVYHPYYRPYYRPVVYRSYYRRPVVYRSYYRHGYERPMYHRGYHRW
jgi:hypothetical protein